MLTVVTWKWRGWRGDSFYNHWHVNTLEYMFKQHLKIPHRFVCVTDDPQGVKCETIPLWEQPHGIHTGNGRPNCWRRIKVFSPEATELFGPTILSVDLDTIVLSDITPLVTDDDFKAMKGKAAPLNGSMFLHKTGTRTNVWTSLSRHAPDLLTLHERKTDIRHYGSDQAWMSFKLPDAPVWTEADGAYHFTLLDPKQDVPDDCRILFFAGANKPWHNRCKERTPRAHEAYRKAYHEANYGCSSVSNHRPDKVATNR